jgi:hypothetical protein
MDGINPKFRSLRHDHIYAEQELVIEAIPGADAVLRGLTWAIANGAEVFDAVPHLPHIRIAKSDQVLRSAGTLPRIRIWFQILNDQEVLLKWIEAEADEPYGHGWDQF